MGIRTGSRNILLVAAVLIAALLVMWVSLSAQTAATIAMNVQAHNSNGHVMLEWNYSGDSHNGFYVMRRTSGESAWSHLTTVSGDTTRFLDTGANGTDYLYQVAPFSNSDSTTGQPVSGVNELLSPPTDVIAEAVVENNEILGVRLSFNDASFDQVNLHTFYHIYKDGNAEQLYYEPTPDNGRVTYLDSDATDSGSTYSYEVKVAAGISINYETYLSDRSDAVSVTIPTLVGKAPAPENFSVVHNNGNVQVSWDAIQDNGITGYQITRKFNGVYSVIVEDTGDATSYTDDTVDYGNTYKYRMRGINDYGLGTRAKTAVVVVPTQVDSVSNLTHSFNIGEIVLSWDAVTGASNYSVNDGEQVHSVLTGTSFTVGDVVEDSSYTFTVYAQDSETTSNGVEIVVTTPSRSDAPTGLTAESDGTSIVLSWDDPGDNTITGYQILRRKPSLGESSLVVHVENTGTSDTTFTDENVTEHTKHVYRVRAIRGAVVSDSSPFVNHRPCRGC